MLHHPIYRRPPDAERVAIADGSGDFLPGVPLGCCLAISTRWMDEPRRPPFERHQACIRNAVALTADHLAASPDGLVSRSCKPCPDEASDYVTTDPIDAYNRFLGGAVRAAGKQF
jgi:hypothetical protein